MKVYSSLKQLILLSYHTHTPVTLPLLRVWQAKCNKITKALHRGEDDTYAGVRELIPG